MPPPSPPGYDNDLALRLAAACDLAYTLVAAPETAAPDGYQVTATFSVNLLGRTEVFGYLMTSGQNSVLAFRGTDSFADFVADGTYTQVAFPYVEGAGVTHAGFTDVYASCRDAVLTALRAAPADRPLFITGHSLGGALATFAALDAVANSPFTAPIVYTFASPRVGDPAFADAYDARVGISVRSSWRVLNTYDIVPLLPPERIFDGLHRRYCYYRHVDEWLPITFLKGGVQANHALANYIAALQDTGS
jgi:triacylglycerol lipase